jgi:hypothetical protein
MDKRTLRNWGLFFLFTCLLVTRDALADPPKAKAKLADYFGFQPLELYKLESRIGNLLLKDLDGDQIDDIVVSNNARSRIDLFLSTKKPAEEAAARPFRTDVNELNYDNRMRLVSIPVNKAVVSIDTGDFNGDGKPDLVFYGTPAEVEILINEGQGHFASAKKINTGEAVERPSALTVGDLDQDGRDDIALLDKEELVLVYQTTPGSLSEPERVPHTASNPWLIRAVDLDGNGARDLVIVDSETDHPIHARFATDEKKLGPEQRFALASLGAIAFGQVDGKGGVELLVVEGQTNRAKVLTLDRSGSGDDDKRGRLVYFALPRGTERGRSVAVGDVDGDGRKDVVVSDPANAQVWVYFQTKGSGLSAGQSFPSLVGAKTVRLAKLEASGNEDVFVLSDQEKQIGRSSIANGRLTFPTPVSIVGDPVAMDLVNPRAGKDLQIFYIVRAKPVDPKASGDAFELRAVAPDKSGTFQPVKWGRADSVALPGVTALPPALKTLDVNQDGQTDVLVFNQYGSPMLLVGQKDGPPRPFSGSLGPLSAATPAGVSQMDLGGPALLVAQNTFARRILLGAQGNWTTKDQYNAGRTSANILGAAALDTDGDGTKEIVLLDRASKSLLFLSLKEGVYRPNGSLSIGAINFEGMHVADFDGDGRDDLLIAGTDKFAVLQTGRKGLGLKVIATYESKRHEARLSDLAVGDVNGDGSPDVVFTDVAEQSLEIATYAADKELLPAITFKIFERKTFRNIGDLIEPRDMAIGDVDGDGRADIVLVIHDRVLVYRQDPGKPPAQLGQSGDKKPVAAKSKP